MLNIPGVDKSLVAKLQGKLKAREPLYYSVAPYRTGRIDSVTGKPEANPCQDLPDGKIWLRADFDAEATQSRAAVPAIIVGVRNDVTDAPVWGGMNSDNPGASLCAIGVRGTEETVAQYGTYLAGIGTPNTPSEAQNNPIPSRLLQGGRVVLPVSGGGLNLFVEADPETGWAGSTIPVDPGDVPGVSGQYGFLVVYFPYEGIGEPTYRPQYAVTTPVPTMSKDTLLVSYARDLQLPVGSLRSFAVTIGYGQTDINSATSNAVDLRNLHSPTQPKNNYTAILPPTVTDDEDAGYEFGSQWWDTVGGLIYDCVDATSGAAVWQSRAGSAITVQDSTGTPSYSGINTLAFVGGTLTNPSAGTAEYTAPGGGSGGLTLIAAATLSVDTASVSITSISGSYKLLRLELSLRSKVSAVSDELQVQANGDSGAGDYQGQRDFAQGSYGANQNVGNFPTIVYLAVPGNNATAAMFCDITATFNDYVNSNRLITAHAEGGFLEAFGSGNTVVERSMGCVNLVGPLTRIDILCAGGNIAAHSSYALYGLS